MSNYCHCCLKASIENHFTLPFQITIPPLITTKAGNHVIYRVYISSAARWALSLHSSSIEFVLLSVSENGADWVCRVEEGYRPTTIKEKILLIRVVRMANCLLWCRHHQRQTVFFSRTLPQAAAGDGMGDCCCLTYLYIYFFSFNLPSLALGTTEGFEHRYVQITLCWHACGVFRLLISSPASGEW